ncbi:MAG: GtrA family protein [Paludibacteraceae bacterium]|nr:GtrA family protein [Paludibacteraceae bacterium]
MQKVAQIITKIIDFFYPPFRKWVPEDVFRYGVCGGGNMVLDWVLYFLLYNYVVGHELVYIYHFLPYIPNPVCISPHIMALCIVFPITLLTGFWLNKYVTFRNSTLHGGQQLVRYILIVLLNLLINYAGLKLLVDVIGWYPTPSKMCITLITIVVSYLGQRYYSFRH